MTIDTFQNGAVATLPQHGPSDEVARLIQWAEAARAAFSLAEMLCATSFCPESFRGKPQEGAAAICAGGEVGLSPMAALQAFDIIQGRAAPRAITLRAVVQSKGHDMELVDSTSARCVMRGRRVGKEQWQQITWTIDRAKQLKLTGKPNWQNQPTAMLLARATSELARLIAADAILGIPYSYEELQDGFESEDERPARRTVKRAPARTALTASPAPDAAPSAPAPAVAQEGPPLPGEEEQEADAAPPSPITDPQMAKMHACFNDVGITERDDRLAYAAEVIGRDITTSKELTVGEASAVIEALVADASGEPRDDGSPPLPSDEPDGSA